MKRLIYRLRYAWRLHTQGGLTITEALHYPSPGMIAFDGNPIEDADAEISRWSED